MKFNRENFNTIRAVVNNEVTTEEVNREAKKLKSAKQAKGWLDEWELKKQAKEDEQMERSLKVDNST